jgi:hypothetical protein
MTDTENSSNKTGGVMTVAVKTEKGYTLTNQYGFTVEEEHGKVLAFDLFDHPELGTTVLFGNQVFVLKFWDDADLEKGLTLVKDALEKEQEKRKGQGEIISEQ